MISVKQIARYIRGKHVTINKTAFFINQEYILDHYHNVFLQLNKDDFDIILADKFSEEKYVELIDGLKLYSWNVKFLRNVLYIYKYKVLVTHLYIAGNTVDKGTVFTRLRNIFSMVVNKFFPKINLRDNQQYFQKKLGIYNIRFMYGADVDVSKFGRYNNLFDHFFCHGPRDSVLIKEYLNKPVFEMGCPQYDDYFLHENNLNLKIGLLDKYSCDKNKKTILWICTVSRNFSTIEKYSSAMRNLTREYNVILRPHPMEIDPQYSRYNERVYHIVNSGAFILNDDAYQNMWELYLISDFIFCDYGGSIFSAMYVNKKIMLMNHENAHLDPNVHGSTSMEIREYLPSIDDNDSNKIEKYLNDDSYWNDGHKRREEARSHYFGSHENTSSMVANKFMDIKNSV